jgi:putative addiction module component (TIGR02574 family)
MAETLPIPPPGFDDLSVEGKLDYVQSLWDRIAARPEELPVPDWHRQEPEARLAAYRADPQGGKPWEEVREEIRRQLRDRSRER